MGSLPTPERPLGQGTTLAGGGISEEEQVEDSQRPKTKAGTKQPCQEQVSGSPIACVLTQQCEQAKDHGGRPVTRDALDHQAEQDDRRHKRRSFVAAHRAYSLLAASGGIQTDSLPTAPGATRSGVLRPFVRKRTPEGAVEKDSD